MARRLNEDFSETMDYSNNASYLADFEDMLYGDNTPTLDTSSNSVIANGELSDYRIDYQLYNANPDDMDFQETGEIPMDCVDLTLNAVTAIDDEEQPLAELPISDDMQDKLIHNCIFTDNENFDNIGVDYDDEEDEEMADDVELEEHIKMLKKLIKEGIEENQQEFADNGVVFYKKGGDVMVRYQDQEIAESDFLMKVEEDFDVYIDSVFDLDFEEFQYYWNRIV